MLGTIPIVTAGTAMEENVRAFGFGSVVSQGSAQQLAEAIQERAFQPAQVEELQRVRGAILARMGPGEVARQHRWVYESILGQAAP